MIEHAMGRMDRDVDALERQMRDVQKRLDKLESQIEKMARRDLVPPLQAHLQTVEIKSDIDPLGR